MVLLERNELKDSGVNSLLGSGLYKLSSKFLNRSQWLGVGNREFAMIVKPSFHMVVNVSRLCRKRRRDRVRVYLDDTCDTVATRSRPYGN